MINEWSGFDRLREWRYFIWNSDLFDFDLLIFQSIFIFIAIIDTYLHNNYILCESCTEVKRYTHNNKKKKCYALKLTFKIFCNACSRQTYTKTSKINSKII